MKRDAEITEDSWSELKPSLLVMTDNGKPQRQSKREKPIVANEHCQRHSLYVDFKLVSWHQWIVAPGGYHAYFCDGECRCVYIFNRPIAKLLASTVFGSAPLSCGMSSIPGVRNSYLVHPLGRCLCGS